jgi:hypothetical protein
MNLFDKICACVAIPIGMIFLILGIIGFFAGSQAHFTLPPILGGLPFFLGWAMSITLIKFWRQSSKSSQDDIVDVCTLPTSSPQNTDINTQSNSDQS